MDYFYLRNLWSGMNQSSILVVGSSNTDMVIQADHLPLAGETVLGGRFFMNPGGKGANQAVAAARLGGRVTFIAKTGNDIFGKQSIQLFSKEGIDASYSRVDPIHPSGVALITVDRNAENCIVVASGANAQLSPSDLFKAKGKIQQAGIILMQLEIPVDTVQWVVAAAAEKGVRVILNPAPVCELPDELLRGLSVITPNQKEAEMLTGIKLTDQATFKRAAKKLQDKGIETVIITLGPRGALLLQKGEYTMVRAPVVKAVDTTAAGDTFNGALAVALVEGLAMTDAVQFACNAAAISVTRPGAQASIPYRKEVLNLKS
jgi:ribokinase